MISFFDAIGNYIHQLTFADFLRAFWFFFIFEFLRFFALELVVLILWKIKMLTKRHVVEQARKNLFISHPFVSIIVPGKNEGGNIFNLVNSLKAQTYSNFELIVIDDGSDDDTALICSNLKQNGFIDLFLSNTVNGGKASAANLGLRFAKGEIIIHLDADSSYDSDAIENILIPFFIDPDIGAVGGNVTVGNYNKTLCTTLQAIEYIQRITVGRIVLSELGIYRIISGAFGAFRKTALQRVGGWDVGPGLDGDITVKVRKMGYKIYFQPTAVCLTNAPVTFSALIKQRLRWDKSLIRFRLRKHVDVFFPNKAFKLDNFISFTENIMYSLVSNIKWYVYLIDIVFNFSDQLPFIFVINILLYSLNNFLKYMLFYLFRDHSRDRVLLFLIHIPCLVFYYGYFLIIIRSVAYFQEIFFKASYNDPWNPPKTSRQARMLNI